MYRIEVKENRMDLYGPVPIDDVLIIAKLAERYGWRHVYNGCGGWITMSFGKPPVSLREEGADDGQEKV